MKGCRSSSCWREGSFFNFESRTDTGLGLSELHFVTSPGCAWTSSLLSWNRTGTQECFNFNWKMGLGDSNDVKFSSDIRELCFEHLGCLLLAVLV